MVREIRSTPAGERTRERILQEAIPLFAEYGFAGTSVRQVATAASVNVATLAYHFTDKAGLYQASVDRVYQVMQELEADQEALMTSGNPVRGIIEVVWNYCQNHKKDIRLLHRHVLDHGSQNDRFVEHWMDPILQRFRPLLSVVRPDWSEMQFRRTLVTVLHLLVRMSLDDPDHSRALLAIEGDFDEAIIDWLTDLAMLQLTAR